VEFLIIENSILRGHGIGEAFVVIGIPLAAAGYLALRKSSLSHSVPEMQKPAGEAGSKPD
jgi:hypothetical protein